MLTAVPLRSTVDPSRKCFCASRINPRKTPAACVATPMVINSTPNRSEDRRQYCDLNELWQIREWKGHSFHLADDVFNWTEVRIWWNPRDGKGRRAMRAIRVDTAVLGACLHRPPAIDAFKTNCVLGRGRPTE